MDDPGSELEINKEKSRCSAQLCPEEGGQGRCSIRKELGTDGKWTKHSFEYEQEKDSKSVLNIKSQPGAKFQNVESIDADIIQHKISNKGAVTVSSENASQATHREKPSRLPTPVGKKLETASIKRNKNGLQKRRPRDELISDNSCLLESPVVLTDRPTPRFPEVSSGQAFHSLRTRSSVRPLGCGGPERPPRTALPPIRTPDGAFSVRSRIPVRTRSADCRTGHQAARRSARPGSCGSAGGHQTARRSGRPGSCGSASSHQAARRFTRSSSCVSDRGHQLARGYARRSSSCSSVSSRQMSPCRHSAASNWSFIDVNNNARLLLEGHIGTALEHEYHGRRRKDLIVLEQKPGHDEKTVPALPHVKRPQHEQRSAAGRSWAVGRSPAPFRSPRRTADAPRPSPASPHPAGAGSQRSRDPGPAPGAAGSGSRRRASDPRTPPEVLGADPPAPRVSHALRYSPKVPRAGRPSPKAPETGCSSPKATEAGCSSPKVPGAGSSLKAPGAGSSPKAPGAGRRPTVQYRPNLTPYPRQYILLGLLGPDPERIKRRQDKMRRRREYVKRQTLLSRAAAQRRSPVPLRVCSAGSDRPGHCSRSPQPTEDRETQQPASDESIEREESSISRDQRGQNSTIEELTLSPPEQCQLTAGGGSRTCSPTRLDTGCQTAACTARHTTDSDSDSASESVSESSLQWSPEEAGLVAVDPSELTAKLEEVAAEVINAETGTGDGVMMISTTSEQPGIETEGSGTKAERPGTETEKASEGVAELETLPFETTVKVHEDTLSICEVEVSEIRAPEPKRHSPAPKAGMETHRGVTEMETIVPTRSEVEAFPPDMAVALTDEDLVTENWAAVPAWVRSATAEGTPVWAGHCILLAGSELTAEEEPDETKISPVSELDGTPPAALLGEEVFITDARRHADAIYDYVSGSISVLDSDTSDSNSDSDAEMVDALEDLPTAAPCPDPPPPTLPDEGGYRGPARRCSSSDVFLELPEQVSVRVTAGRCRGEGAGCSCSPLAAAISRATQSPDQDSSFVFRNLLVVDIRSDGGMVGPAVGGISEEAGTGPGPGPGQGRRRRWSSQPCPALLQLEGGRAVPGYGGARWSEEVPPSVEMKSGHKQEECVRYPTTRYPSDEP